MGTLMVANMAPEGLESSHKKLHPFFVPGKHIDPPQVEPSAIQKTDEQPPIKRPGRPRKQPLTPQNPSSDIEALSSDVGEDGRDPKRQKTGNAGQAPPKKRGRPRKKRNDATTDTTNQTLQNNTAPSTSLINEVPQTPPGTEEKGCTPKSAFDPAPKIEATETTDDPKQDVPKPTKLLKFNPKTGTIGSPPKPKPASVEASKGAKSAKSPAKSSRIVTIKYGHDADSRARIGPKIEQILESPFQKQPSPRSKTSPRKARAKAPKANEKPKDTHPLFLGKSSNAAKPPATSTAPPKPSRVTVFTSTPCSPKKQRSAPMVGNLPQFGMRPMGHKVPGSCHPAWPAKGMAHVRGLAAEDDRQPTGHHTEVTSRKSKGQTTNILPGESVIDQLSQSLNTLRIKESVQEASEDYQPQPPELRLPQKHFESGRKLRSRIRPELRTVLPVNTHAGDESDEDILAASTRKPHAAVARLYNALETNLSAHDRSQCEELTWAHKYAPLCAKEVLQSGQEGVLLKEWLETLKVQSIAGAAGGDQKTPGSKPSSATKKKRKRNKMDGFIVSSEDEIEFLPSISDDEDDWFPTHIHGSAKKTVVRRDVSKDTSRLTNAVVLSGPHGSGKTAAVYAVAKELGFEVFEINASSRRNGKDVMEKVGDMTQNHLVQHSHHGGKDDKTLDDETAKDIKSGKQGTMMSFFKPKAATGKPAPKPELPLEPTLEPTLEPQTEDDKAPKSVKAKAQNQKQSLILLEEVDILYEEDKQFWATIMSLVAQSKRPFVMTCNDENMVPFHNFILYGIFRFAPPPTDLAVDVLLLIAANEGHALRRAAVAALYESKGQDLRASLMELNYWCQLGVGDRRGGFDWFYPRWPKGCDKDDNGDVVRVVSKGTYLEGMGWVSRDPAITPNRAAEEELMSQCWQGLGIDLGNWHDSLDMSTWANGLETSSAGSRAAALDAFSEFSDAMSAADLCSSGDFGIRLQESLDPTQPEIPNKMRDDFILGRRLIEAPPLRTYTYTATAISSSLKSAARRILHAVPTSAPTAVSMDCIHESKAIDLMRQSFSKSNGDTVISRYDLSLAFDPIAVSEKAMTTASTTLEPSIFDRTMRMITIEVAPYVRSIIGYDHRMMQGRMQKSSLLSEGGRPGKRMRSTRSALSAQEGVARAYTRRENYFSADVNTLLVMRTGGDDWQAAVDAEMRLMERLPSPPPSEAADDGIAPLVSTEASTRVAE